MYKKALVVVVLALAFEQASYAEDASVEPKKAQVDAKADNTEKEKKQAWWQHLVFTVITTTGTIAVPVLSTLLVVLLRRWNIKVEYEKAEWVAKQGKNYAEQLARNALKEGYTVNNSDTSKTALKYSRELAAGKLAPWAARELAGLIEASLGEDNRAKEKPGPVATSRDLREAPPDTPG